MKYGVALGEMFDAINFYGPFDDFDSAELWADNNSSANWWIIRLEKPMSDQRNDSRNDGHLPECLLPDFDKGGWVCICHLLRACEQRVREEHSEVDAYRGWVKGYVAGVSAAYEAVLNAGLCAPHRCQSDALAAIDALRGKSND